MLDWALERAHAAGFASVTVACEPTGHRWRVLDQLAATRGLALVCVQPLLVYRAREGEDLTRDKSDPKDAVLIARLASELRCYEPERAGAVWARLRHLGARRRQLTTAATAAVNQIRDLLECAWPAVLAASPSPFRSVSWCASLSVVLDRCAGDLSRVRRLGLDRFTAAVRRELPRWGGIRPCLRIIRAVFAALSDPAGVTAHRPGALERAHLALGDWRDVRARLADTETRMCAVMDELGLADLVTTIAGLTVIGAAAILAETGDPRRYDSSSSLVKHAGLAPADNASGALSGQAHISRRGRPGLRLAVWRAVWPMLRFNPVMAAKYQALTRAADAAARAAGAHDGAGTRPATAAAATARARHATARVACAASLLRWIYSMAVHGTSWDAAIASGDAGQHTPRHPAEAA